MFNQKVNGYTSQNPDYLNYSLGAPAIKALDIHNCGTTVQRYNKSLKCGSLPLQTWCSKNAAVESFAMRPIVNSKEYFANIQKFFGNIIYTDSIELKKKMMSSESYKILTDYGVEPLSSFLQAINLQVTDKLMYLMAMGSDQIKMFSEYNPLGEGLVMTDLDIDTYQSVSNTNHFYHKLIFSVVNTTRYNTITMKAEAYQDTSTLIDNWNTNIQKVERSVDVSNDTSSSSIIYVSNLNFLNNTSCVTGQENDCQFKGHTLGSSLLDSYSQLTPLNWIEPNSIAENTYSSSGNYDPDGYIKITDYGPDNIEELINSLKK